MGIHSKTELAIITKKRGNFCMDYGRIWAVRIEYSVTGRFEDYKSFKWLYTDLRDARNKLEQIYKAIDEEKDFMVHQEAIVNGKHIRHVSEYSKFIAFEDCPPNVFFVEWFDNPLPVQIVKGLEDV